MYSSLPIGYNHSIFDDSFANEIKNVSKLKVVNCEMLSDEYDLFFNTFKSFTSKEKYSNYAFTCTGALANEAAIKTAMWHKGPRPDGYILSIKNSFHGINSVGNIITTRFQGVDIRQGNLPGLDTWPAVNDIESAIEHIERSDERLQGVIIEPIQATYGDNYFEKELLLDLRDTCTTYDIPLIFDEVQTGFGASGKVWYCDHLDIKPDIITFGKKSQVSGIIVKDTHSKVFDIPKRLSVTFDGDLVDMIRCKYIIKAIQKDDLLNNALTMGKYLSNKLSSFKQLKNIRQTGLLLAFDFETTRERNSFYKNLHKNGMICNPTRDVSIRLRPNLNVSKSEIDNSINLIAKSF
jgi:L-lysine 6-transaminase